MAKQQSRRERLEHCEGLVSDASAQVQELLDEVEERMDNMPENLQGTETYERLEAAKDALEEIVSNLDQCEWQVDFPGMFGK